MIAATTSIRKVFQAIESEVARIQAQFPGAPPSDGSAMMVYIQDDDRDLLLEANLLESFAHLEVKVNAILEFTLSYSGDTIATITFNPGDLLDGEGGQFATIAMD
jgi:hypothetical protein